MALLPCQDALSVPLTLGISVIIIMLLCLIPAYDVLVVGGGTIPDSDIPELQAKGVQAVFGPGSSIAEIVTYIREHAPRRS